MNDKKSKFMQLTSRDNTMPGYFTGIYTNKSISSIPRIDRLNKFLDDLEISNNEPQESNFYFKEKIQYGINGLPLVSSLLDEMGHYGLIFNSVLNLCQYYKKKSPSLVL